jgi:hypothetical protein
MRNAALKVCDNGLLVIHILCWTLPIDFDIHVYLKRAWENLKSMCCCLQVCMRSVKECVVVYRFVWEVLKCVLLSTGLNEKC